MSADKLSASQIDDISRQQPEQRLKYLVNQAVERKQLWILTDEHGAVMLTTEEEDCIPVWPNQEFAEMWATGDWQGFEAKAISLTDWLNKWTPGLEEDEIAIVVFPVTEDDGLVLDSYELADEIQQKR
mgnify:CR=1 FL=1